MGFEPNSEGIPMKLYEAAYLLEHPRTLVFPSISLRSIFRIGFDILYNIQNIEHIDNTKDNTKKHLNNPHFIVYQLLRKHVSKSPTVCSTMGHQRKRIPAITVKWHGFHNHSAFDYLCVESSVIQDLLSCFRIFLR